MKLPPHLAAPLADGAARGLAAATAEELGDEP